jgi:S1-C subfamily serine protease
VIAAVPPIRVIEPPPPTPEAVATSPLAPSLDAVAHARDAVMPHVVSILVVREDFEAGEPKLSVSSGSGTVVTPDGHIVTNAHVTDRGRDFRVVFGDGREREATLVGQDPAADLAVLKVSGEPLPMAHARFSDRGALRSGEAVFAMGAPWGLSNSLSSGVVNNPRRLLVSLFEDEADYEDRLDDEVPTGRYYAWIQHDAAIAPGNSGGPLVDLSGEIIGVNTRGMMFGGDLAFAIPAPDVKAVTEALIAHGEVRRSHLGLRLRSLRGSGAPRGVVVNAVERGSPAAKAGVQPGDRLLTLDGQALDAAQAVDVPAIQRRFAELPAGTPISLEVVRDGAARRVSVTPVTEDAGRGAEAAFRPFGMALQALTSTARQALRVESEGGLWVASLRAGGPATTARPPIPEGAVLLAINGQPLRSFADLEAWRAPRRPAVPLAVDYLVDGQRRLSALTPVWSDRVREPLPELPKAWAGVEVQPVPASLATALGLKASGFRITRLYPGSALGKAGAEVGDLLTTLQGEPLDAVNDSRPELFDQRVREFEIGDRVVFEGLRQGSPRRWQAMLAASPVPASGLRAVEVSLLRAQFRDMGFHDRVDRDLPLDQSGVVVLAVEAGGAAGLAHLQAEDVVVRIGGRVIDRLDAVRPALLAAAAQERVAVEILRGNEARIVHIERRWMPLP